MHEMIDFVTERLFHHRQGKISNLQHFSITENHSEKDEMQVSHYGAECPFTAMRCKEKTSARRRKRISVPPSSLQGNCLREMNLTRIQATQSREGRGDVTRGNDDRDGQIVGSERSEIQIHSAS
jgi:hypothetical protein